MSEAAAVSRDHPPGLSRGGGKNLFTVAQEDIGTGAGTIGTALFCAILFPPTGIPALLALIRARALRSSDARAARTQYDRYKRLMFNSLGYGAGWLVVAGLVGLFMVNDYVIARQFFNMEALRASAPNILRGFQLTVALFLIAEVLVLAWALFVAIIRVLPGEAAAPLRWLATAYVDIFRGLPSLLVILIVVFGIKQTRLPFLGDRSEFELVILALVLTYGAYVSEIIRSGINAINQSQISAARSLGLSFIQTMRYVVLAQALRNQMPVLLNSFISLQKDTALVGIVDLLDAVNWARIESLNIASLTPFTAVALGYLLITLPLTRLVDWYQKRVSQRRSGVVAAPAPVVTAVLP